MVAVNGHWHSSSSSSMFALNIAHAFELSSCDRQLACAMQLYEKRNISTGLTTDSLARQLEHLAMPIQLISLAIEALLLQTGHAQTCLTDGGASSFDTVFRNIISKAPGHEELVTTFLSPYFEFVSDSLAFLTGGTVSFTNDTACRTIDQHS